MFTPLALGTNHMLGVDNYVPLMTNNFEIRIYNMDGTSPSANGDLLTLSTSEIGNISEDQDSVTVHYGNGIIKFPTKVGYSDISWTLNCYCSPNVLGALREWRKLVYDPETEKMGLPTDYMKQVYFIRYDGQGRPRDILRAPGTWISAINYGGGNQEGGLVQVETTFVISKLIPLSEEELNM